MSARVDQRPVLERLADLVEAADFERTHPSEPLARCECGATLRRHVGPVTVCAGCGLLPTYQFHLVAATLPGDGARAVSASRERSAPPEVSAGFGTFTARKDADAPGGISHSLGSGVLGRVGNALRSLRLQVNWGAVYGLALTAAFWGLLARVVL